MQGVAAGLMEEVAHVRAKLVKHVEALSEQKEEDQPRDRVEAYARSWRKSGSTIAAARGAARSLPPFSLLHQPSLHPAPLVRAPSVPRERAAATRIVLTGEPRATSLSPLGGLNTELPNVRSFFPNQGSSGSTRLVSAAKSEPGAVAGQQKKI